MWRWQPNDPLDHPDPLKPQQVAFYEPLVRADAPGRYDLALLTGDDDIARQPLLVGPADACGVAFGVAL